MDAFLGNVDTIVNGIPVHSCVQDNTSFSSSFTCGGGSGSHWYGDGAKVWVLQGYFFHIFSFCI